MSKVIEQWKSVVGYEGLYEVSDLGNIRSVERIMFDKNGRRHLLQGKPISQSNDGSGYMKFLASKDNRKKCLKVHKVVVHAFLGLKDGYIVNHMDGYKSNNALSNLEYVTVRENVTHGIGYKKTRTGAHFHKKIGKWISRCSYNNIKVHLGYYDTEDEAADVYQRFLKSINQENRYAR